MNSNYFFAFTHNRRDLVPPASQHPPPAAVAVAASRSTNAANPTNRFSINRLMHVKSSGGCRSCN